jgi:hypothetical protein
METLGIMRLNASIMKLLCEHLNLEFWRLTEWSLKVIESKDKIEYGVYAFQKQLEANQTL